MSFYQPKCFKYDVLSKNFTEIPEWPNNHYRLSFNLLPLIDNRFILIVSDSHPYMLDTKTDKWIQLSQKGHRDLHGVQIGAFTLPIGETFTNKITQQSQVSTNDMTEDILDKSDAPDKGGNDSCDENNDEDLNSQDSRNPSEQSDYDQEDADLYADDFASHQPGYAMEDLGADYAAAMQKPALPNLPKQQS